MKKMKKFAILFSAFCATFTLAFAAACKDKTDPGPGGPSDGETQAEFIFPKDDATIVWETPLSGDGTPYKTTDDFGNTLAKGRFWCDEGYYKATLTANTELFYEFQVFDTGLYALYTMSPVENVTITQYDASIQYIPTDSAGNYMGTAAVVVPEEYGEHAGALYSKINCPAKYFNSNWRATYGIKSTVAQTIELRFVRIGDALPVPETITTKVSAQELKGKYYNDPNNSIDNKDIVNVPWNAKYFYDEDYEIEVIPFAGGDPVKVKGFYRMGTEDNPGNLIYAMITETPSRMFDTTFTQLTSKGASLNLYVATAENGDYLVNDYSDFIMKLGDSKKACYENAVNKDGVYPVNKELYEFLNYYVKSRGCAGMSEEDRATYPDAMWLAPCYYYGNAQDGSQAYPYNLSLGTRSVTIDKENYVYYNVKWQTETNASTNTDITSGYYTVSWDSADVVLKLENDTTHKNHTGSVTFQTDNTNGVKFMLLYTGEAASKTVNITVSKASGYTEKPLSITQSGTLTTQEWFTSESEWEYSATYTYTATQTGALTFSTANVSEGATVTISLNGETFTEATKTLEVAEHDVVTIVISGTSAGQTANITIS